MLNFFITRLKNKSLIFLIFKQELEIMKKENSDRRSQSVELNSANRRESFEIPSGDQNYDDASQLNTKISMRILKNLGEKENQVKINF